MDQALSRARHGEPPAVRVKKHFPRTPLPLLLAFLTLSFAARAHRLDEYLQATLIEIGTNQATLQINFTAGVDTANAVIWLLDLNHDGTISSSEADAYASQVRSQL